MAMQFNKRSALRVAALFAILFLIGFTMRIPAIWLSGFYGMHGVLSAPFFGALAMWHYRHDGAGWQLVAATLLLAALLGMMSPVMGVTFASMAVIAGVVRSVVGGRGHGDLVSAAVFGAVSYPCTLAAGIALGSYFPTSSSVLTIVVMAVLGIALSVFGALLVPSKNGTMGT